jgi:hypothetical protein
MPWVCADSRDFLTVDLNRFFLGADQVERKWKPLPRMNIEARR